MTTTTTDKVSAAFLGFFAFLGTALAVVLLLYLLVIATLVNGKTAPWLQPYTSTIALAAPVLGLASAVVVASRYLYSRRTNTAQPHTNTSHKPQKE